MIQEMEQSGGLMTLAAYTIEVATLGGVTWGAMKGLTIQLDSTMSASKNRKNIKRWSAQLFGPLAGIAAHGMGWLVSPKQGTWGYVGAAFFGYLGTWVAVGAHHGIEAVKAKVAAKKSRLPE